MFDGVQEALEIQFATKEKTGEMGDNSCEKELKKMRVQEGISRSEWTKKTRPLHVWQL